METSVDTQVPAEGALALLRILLRNLQVQVPSMILTLAQTINTRNDRQLLLKYHTQSENTQKAD